MLDTEDTELNKICSMHPRKMLLGTLVILNASMNTTAEKCIWFLEHKEKNKNKNGLAEARGDVDKEGL